MCVNEAQFLFTFVQTAVWASSNTCVEDAQRSWIHVSQEICWGEQMSEAGGVGEDEHGCVGEGGWSNVYEQLD